MLLSQGLTDGRLLQPDNISSLIRHAYVFILAVGMLMVIVASRIDLSAGAVVASVGGVGAWTGSPRDCSSVDS